MNIVTQPTNSLKIDIIYNTIFLGVAELFNKGPLIATGFVIGHVLGASGFGSYSYLLAIVGLLVLCTDFGVTQYLGREYETTPFHKYSLIKGLIVFKVCMGVVIALLSVLTLTVSSTSPGLFLGLLVLYRSISIIDLSRIVYRAQKNSLSEVRLKSIHGICIALPLAGVLWLGQSVPVAIGIQAAVSVCIAGYTIWTMLHTHSSASSSPESGSIAFSQRDLPMLLKDSGVFFASMLFVAVYYYVDILFLEAFRSERVVGEYSAAFKLMHLCIYPLPIIGRVLFTRFKKLYTDAREKFHAVVITTTLVSIGAYGILIPAMIVWGPDILTLLYGSEFLVSGTYFFPLLIAVCCNVLYFVFGRALYATGHHRLFMLGMAIACAVNLLGNIIFTPQYGARGAVRSTIASEAAILLRVVGCYFTTVYTSIRASSSSRSA